MRTRGRRRKLLLFHFQVLTQVVCNSSVRFPNQRLQVLSCWALLFFIEAVLSQGLHQVALPMMRFGLLQFFLQLLKILLAHPCSGGKSLRSRLRGLMCLLTLTWT